MSTHLDRGLELLHFLHTSQSIGEDLRKVLEPAKSSACGYENATISMTALEGLEQVVAVSGSEAQQQMFMCAFSIHARVETPGLPVC